MEKLMVVFSSFVFVFVIVYSFAMILGKTKEVNQEVKKILKAAFIFVVKVVSDVVVFIFSQLKKFHEWAWSKNKLVTAIVEIVLVLVFIFAVF